MQVLGLSCGGVVARPPLSGFRAAVLALLTLFVASLHHADAAEAARKFAAITVDARNGKVLFAQDPDGIRHPASLTKMMTLYVLFQDLKSGRLGLDSPIRMSVRAANMAPTRLGVLPGNTITVETAIKALVVKSANDVACAIAENLGGSEADFAQRMTRTARSIGMSRTTFRNASGLPNPGQVTTARDMATLGLRLMRDFPQYYPYFRIQSFTYNGRTIAGHNRLLGKFEGTDGIKTGYINASGFNLVSSVKRGDKRLVGVVLGGNTGAARDKYMMKMLAARFDDASSGRTIAAMAGSSKGVITPPGGDQGTAQPPLVAELPAPGPKPGKRLKDKDGSPIVQAANTAKAQTQPEQGDTDEDQAEAAPDEQDPLGQAAAAVPDPAPAPAPQAAQKPNGAAFQQVEAAQPESPAAQPETPQVEQSQLVDAQAPAKLPFQVKTPQQQLADQATVAAIPPATGDVTWMIHLGDFSTKQDAQARLQDLRRRMPDMLQGKEAQTVAIAKGTKVTYRARMLGFDEPSATLACKAIKKKKGVCQVQAPL